MSLLRPAYVSALLSDARFCPAARSGSDLITTPAGDFVSPTVCSVLQLIGNEGVPNADTVGTVLVAWAGHFRR